MSTPNPAPGQTIQRPIQTGDIDAALRVDARLSAYSDVELGLPVLDSEIISFDVDPYVVIDGQPTSYGDAGAVFLSKAGIDSFQRVTTPLDPQTLPMGAFARWRPNLSDLVSPANGGRRWWPIGGARTDQSPRISLQDVGGPTGRLPYGANAPYFDPAYDYQGNGRVLRRPACVFDGKGAMILEPASIFLSATIAFVAVFQASKLTYQGIFEAAVPQEPGEPLVMRYTHGRLDVFQSHTRVVSHETVKPDAFPVLFMLSMDSATNMGRLLVQDQNRTTRTINIAGLEYISLSGVFGAVGQGTTTRPWKNAANMDLLEIDVWDRFMDWPEIEAKANLLSLAYGLAPK